MKNTSGIAVSRIGASHIKAGKECQDRSKYISGKKFSAVVVCDGHGGDKHFRSAAGAEFAISCFEKAISEFADKYHSLLKRNKSKTILSNFEKHLIFSWREAVENHCNKNPFTEEELKIFPEYIRDELKENPHIAYGSTFLACFIIKEELFVIQLGDGEIRLIIENGQVVSPILKDENLKFGMTTSLCNADAIRYVKSAQTKIGDITGCVICSDGVRNSFDTDEHYDDFCRKASSGFTETENEIFESDIKDFLSDLTENGSSDDVSIGLIKI